MQLTVRLLSCLFLFFSFIPAADSQTADKAIELKSLSIDVKADLFMVTTTVHMEFYNPNSRVLDGEYNFSLAAGQVITGFSLDINGFMRDGVIVDKQKGRVAYENTIRRRIDPGLLEMTAGNNYRVRIYPMPADGTRKITISISEKMVVKDNSLHYYLPLDIPYTVRQFDTKIAVASGDRLPLTGEGLLSRLLFHEEKDSFLLADKGKDKELKQPLSFHIPLPLVDRLLCINKTDGITRFALHIRPGLPSAPAAVASATVFWDVSSSAEKRDIKKDIALLQNFIQERSVRDLTIVTFSNKVQETRAYHGRSMINPVRRFLQSQTFDGGTHLGSLDCTRFNSDIFLLFTDGMNNFGNEKIRFSGKPVYCISSAAATDHAALKRIAAKTGGKYIDLYATEINRAISQLNTVQRTLVQVLAGDERIGNDQPLVFDEWLSLSGEIKTKAGQLTLLFGENGRIIKRETIQLDATPSCENKLPAMLPVLQDYEQLLQEDNGQLLLFAKQHKLVTATTSFIVLDNLNDYIQYGITPPADLQEEYNKMIYVIKEQEQQQKTNEENAVMTNLQKSVALYNERISWWGKKDLISLQEVQSINDERKLAITRRGNETPAVQEERRQNSNNASFLKTSNNSLEAVVVTGYGTQRRKNLTGSAVTIQSNQIGGLGGQNVEKILQGRIPGLQVTSNTNFPGVDPKLYIRGAGSLGSGNTPLYIIDGFPVDADMIATMNANDIETISVFKDASASILYGSRAANGAIVITTKRIFRSSNQYRDGIAKYKELEDVEYLTELKDSDKEEMYKRYLQMKDSLGKDPAFYFDVAQLMFESGDKERALRILTNLAEMDNENHQLLRAMGYVLESWNKYDEAIDVYTKVLQIKEEEPQSYRDLALAYEKKGDHQHAVDILYRSLTKNWFQYEDRYRGLKSLVLNEMNAIIARNGKSLDLSEVNAGVIRPLPVDLRIVVDWNKDETDIDLHVVEPGGETCFYSNRLTKSGGRLSEDFTQGYGPEEYQVKEVKKGRYAIRVNYYGDRYQQKQVPSFIKLTIYKNFGRPNQSVTVQSIIMNNQTGMVEIGEMNY